MLNEWVAELHSHKSYDDFCNGWDEFCVNEISSLCYVLFLGSRLYFNPFKNTILFDFEFSFNTLDL